MENTVVNLTLTQKVQRVLGQACIVDTAVPLTPPIRLYLLDESCSKREFTNDEAKTIMDEPPYWAFCWGSGQVLSKWILEHREIFQDKTVLDFGSGSGVVAISAALCGARRVIAVDNDPLALEAINANAELNRVHVEIGSDLGSVGGDQDVVLAADVLYDRENMPFLQRFTARAPMVVIADSRVSDLNSEPYKKIAQVQATTWPDLDEGDEFRLVSIYLAKGPAARII